MPVAARRSVLGLHWQHATIGSGLLALLVLGGCNTGSIQRRTGDVGQPCEQDQDCPSAVCHHPSGLSHGVCSRSCGSREDCPTPDGWSCLAGEQDQICQCNPTGADSDCDGVADCGSLNCSQGCCAGDHCVSPTTLAQCGSQGQTCGACPTARADSCGPDGTCRCGAQALCADGQTCQAGQCTGQPAGCGDGTKSATEECDTADFGGATCQTLGFSGGALTCGIDCKLITTACEKCGDGNITGDEACDGTNLAGKTCASEGFQGGTLQCTSTCTLDTSGCYKCGDHVKNGAEECDTSDLGGKTCQSLGHDGGALKCSASCTLDKSGCYKCGDGTLSPSEPCEGANLGTKTCKTEGFDGGTLKCSAGCTLDTASCFKCGDQKKNGTEQCDATDFGTASCSSFGYDKGVLKCSATCLIDSSACEKCGDNKASGAELCDGADLGGRTCKGEGFGGGMLRCNPGCTLDTSWCYKVVDPAPIPLAVGTTSQSSPAVAFDGTNYLVVWDDGVNSPLYTAGDIYGSRVTKAAVVMDSLPIAISKAANIQSAPAVVFDGEDFLVTWNDSRGACCAGASYDLYGSRVSSAGITLDVAGVGLSTAAGEQSHSSVACGTADCLLVWGPGDINGVRVSKAGALIGTAFVISNAAGTQTTPSVAFDGTSYLVVWTDGRSASGTDIYGARVSAEGVLLDATGIAISTAGYNQNYPAVAFDGTNFLAVWSDARKGYSDFDIYGARVTPSGGVAEATGIPISKATNSRYTPAVACDGTHCLVVWDDRRSGFQVYGTPVTKNGDVIEAAGILIASAGGASSTPALAYDGQRYFVVWKQTKAGTNDTSDIYGVRVSR